MYEQIRDNLMYEFSKVTDKETVNKLLMKCDMVLKDYEFSVKETGIAVYDFQTPVILKTYIECIKLKGCSPLTAQNREYTLTDMFKMIGKSPAQIDTNDVRTYLYYLKNNKGLSDATLNNYLTQISAFFTWCVTDGYANVNPCVRIDKFRCEKKQRHALKDNEMDKIISAATNEKDKAIMEFMYSTGCRVSELCGVKIEDIDFEQNESGEYDVHLFGKGKKHRTSYLTPDAFNSVNAYLKTRHDANPYLFINRFGEQMSRKAIWDICNKLQESAGIKGEFSPHIVRHTSATHAINSGMALEEVQDFLGHESPNTTQIYAEMNKERVKASHRKAFNGQN